MSLRLEFVLRSLTEPTPFRTLCAEYGVSPKTGYKWKQRFFQEGSSGLHDQSRRPAASPAALPEQVVCEIVRLKQAHRTWGPRKIRELYARRHRAQPLPSESSVKRVLDKAGLVEKRRSRRSRDTGRLQSRVDAQAPNDVWTVDFKAGGTRPPTSGANRSPSATPTAGMCWLRRFSPTPAPRRCSRPAKVCSSATDYPARSAATTGVLSPRRPLPWG
ncbi:MAG: helix-turn-helix domain-containing protein [Deltaproteobacteria bacterium]|nr:helix-turn-helix domain-containing protein [Deltaproteobacteria bacterium]